MGKRFLVSGYYGFDNLGDELILQVLAQELKKQGVALTAFSQNPAKTQATYDIQAIPRLNPAAILKAMANTDLFISGGGGLFQDATGLGSVLYYGGLILLARLLGKPVFFWSQGVGPLRGPLSRWMTALALRACRGITVRDEGSARLVQELTGQRPEVTADPVWLLEVPKNRQSPALSDSACNIGVSLRSWPDLTPQRIGRLARCLITLSQQSPQPLQVSLLPFQPEQDLCVLQSLKHQLKQGGVEDTVLVDPSDILQAMGRCRLLIGMRFHSLILGLHHQIPVYGLIYDPKVGSLLQDLHLSGIEISRLEALAPEDLLTLLTPQPLPDLAALKVKAQLNIQRLLG